MTTPAFVATDTSTLDEVRYFTPFDPYYYTVDNRPLVDLRSNVETLGEGSSDSARRAALLVQQTIVDIMEGLFGSTNVNGKVNGLEVTIPSTNVVTVATGAVYQKDAINSSSAVQVLKQALLPQPTSFTLTPPSTSGQSVDYLIQAQAHDLTGAWMASGSSQLFYIDGTNNFLPCLLLNKELSVAIKAGSPASTGSQVTPTADSGFIPLYKVTLTYGVTDPVIQAASSAPDFAGSRERCLLSLPATSGGVFTDVNSIPTVTLADAVSTKVSSLIALNHATVSPYKPIRAEVILSTSAVANGNATLQLSYVPVNAGAAMTPVSLSSEIVGVTTGVANKVTLTGSVPVSAFSGVSSTSWSVLADALGLTLTRLGADSNDSLVGNLYVHSITLTQ